MMVHMKKPEPTTTVTLRLPASLVAAMKTAAEADDRSLSYIALRWLRLGKDAAVPAPTGPAVPAPPPKAAPKAAAKPIQRRQKADDAWWQALQMGTGKPPGSRAVGILKAANVASLEEALALSDDAWRELRAGPAILEALNRAR